MQQEQQEQQQKQLQTGACIKGRLNAGLTRIWPCHGLVLTVSISVPANLAEMERRVFESEEKK